MEKLIFPVLSTFFASLFFGMSLAAPKRTLVAASFLGFLGFLVYEIIVESGGSEYSAAFFGTLAACIPAEIFARTIKTPATVIIFISVIPLVPGLMLYQAMLFFAQNQLLEGASMLIRTLIYACCMAIAVTISTMTGKHLLNPLFKIINRKTEKS
jgi:uncharacterized membrane protein YjjB (DUF3815 family)